jgi:hypothetical protein
LLLHTSKPALAAVDTAFSSNAEYQSSNQSSDGNSYDDKYACHHPLVMEEPVINVRPDV